MFMHDTTIVFNNQTMNNRKTFKTNTRKTVFQLKCLQ